MNRPKPKLRDALQVVAGVGLLVAGVALWSKPAALCVFGVVLLLDGIWGRRITG